MKKILFSVLFLSLHGRGILSAQNIGINTDGSTPETNVMLDIKAPSTNAKATTAAVQTFFQIHSYDATTDALKLRLGFKTDATQANRYGFIDFPDFAAGTPTYLNLALQPSGGNVGIGTTAPNEQLEITKNFRLPATTGSTVGVIYSGANRFIHNYGTSSY